jgi:hypothetical protein
VAEVVIFLGAGSGEEQDLYRSVCPYINAFASRSDYERWPSSTREGVTPRHVLEAGAMAVDLDIMG